MSFPKDIGECKKGELAMISGEVIFADFLSHNQCVRLTHRRILQELIHSWSGYLPQDNDIRLSRFKTDYGGMPALAIRDLGREERKLRQIQG